MTPLHFIWLNSSYAFTLDNNGIKVRQDHLHRCRAAMAGAIGGGAGQLVSGRDRFRLRMFALGVPTSCGGVWALERLDAGSEGEEIVRLAVCRDISMQLILWTGAHFGHELCASRPVNTPPRLPWAAYVTGMMMESSNGAYRAPFQNSPEHLAVAWWQIHEAGGLG